MLMLKGSSDPALKNGSFAWSAGRGGEVGGGMFSDFNWKRSCHSMKVEILGFYTGSS